MVPLKSPGDSESSQATLLDFFKSLYFEHVPVKQTVEFKTGANSVEDEPLKPQLHYAEDLLWISIFLLLILNCE